MWAFQVSPQVSTETQSPRRCFSKSKEQELFENILSGNPSENAPRKIAQLPFQMQGIWIWFKQQLVQNILAPFFHAGAVGDDVIKRLALDFLNTGLWQLSTDCRAPQWHTQKPALVPSHFKAMWGMGAFLVCRGKQKHLHLLLQHKYVVHPVSFLGKCLLSPLPVECIPPWRLLTSQSYAAGNSFACCRVASMYGLL